MSDMTEAERRAYWSGYLDGLAKAIEFGEGLKGLCKKRLAEGASDAVAIAIEAVAELCRRQVERVKSEMMS